MEIVTVLWCFFAAIASLLAAVFGVVWLVDRRHLASLILCVVGFATAGTAFGELGLMQSTTTAEYGEWVRWYHAPGYVAVVGQLLFVHYYLGTGRSWLLWAFIVARSVILVVNFSVHPNFNDLEIVSLGHVSLFGEQVATRGVFVPRTEWQWLAPVSFIFFTAYLVDAAVQQWRKGGRDSRHKALIIGLGIAVPMLFFVVYAQLRVYGVISGPQLTHPVFLGMLLVMAYELGREVVLSRRAWLELAELRIQLAQGERISLMGQLASTLAHELSQPLAATSANVDAAREQLKREKPDIEELDSILDDIGKDDRRATEIIDRMRQLFKRRTIEMQPLSMEEVVQDVISLVRQEATSKHVELHLLMQPGLPHVFGDRVHLSQVLLNLLMNSIHALQGRPRDARRIVIETRTDDANGEVEVAVRDSGQGIPDQMKDEIFKPFFTTKSQGMGMGLALSRTIIDAHGGRMWTDHTPQQNGAIFRFTLRRAPSLESEHRSPSLHAIQEGVRPEAPA